MGFLQGLNLFFIKYAKHTNKRNAKLKEIRIDIYNTSFLRFFYCKEIDLLITQNIKVIRET